MAQPVNLNRYRKARVRADKKAQADENAVKFGRSKAEKELERARSAASKAHVDQHKLDK